MDTPSRMERTMKMMRFRLIGCVALYFCLYFCGWARACDSCFGAGASLASEREDGLPSRMQGRTAGCSLTRSAEIRIGLTTSFTRMSQAGGGISSLLLRRRLTWSSNCSLRLQVDRRTRINQRVHRTRCRCFDW